MTPPAAPERDKHHGCPGERIGHGGWLDARLSRRDRDGQEPLFERGIDVSYDAMRQWCGAFGQEYAKQCAQE